MLENIYNNITLELEILYKEAIVNELTGDMKSYLQSVNKIAAIASALGIETDIQNITIKLKSNN